MNKFCTIFLLAVALCAAGCAKKPESVQECRLSIVPAEGDGQGYTLVIMGVIQNDNHSDAFTDVEGELVLLDRVSGAEAGRYTFKAARILPFSGAIVSASAAIDKAAAGKLVDALALDRESFEKDNRLEDVFLGAQQVSLARISYDTNDIIDMLEGKIDENVQ
jgi:hypothetical protein